MRNAAIAAVSFTLFACDSAAEPQPMAAKPRIEREAGQAGAAAPAEMRAPANLPWPPSDEPPPPRGGETGSWTPTPCGGVSEPVVLERDAAAELGFAVHEVADWLERGVDAELRWTPRAPQSGETWHASGYESRTRVEAILRVTSIEHVRPSAKYCDGTTCQFSPDHEPLDQARCPTQLRVHFTLALRTLDRALYVNTRGYMLMHSEQIGEPTAELEVHGGAFSEVGGLLQIDDAERAHATALYTEFLLKNGELSGILRPTLVYAPPALRDLDIRSPSLSPQDRLQYGGIVPVQGEWPR